MSHPPPADLRSACAACIAAVLDGRSLDAARATHLGALPEHRRALAREMTDGTVRWQVRLDWQLHQLLQKPLPRKSRVVNALLLLGLYQLQFMHAPAPRVVNESVAATRRVGAPGLASLVNAVLRRASGSPAAWAPASMPDTARYAAPAWLLQALQADWPEQAADLLRCCNERAPMTLRVNTRRVDRDGLLRTLTDAGIAAAAGVLLPTSVQLEKPLAARALPGFAEGLCSVQDEGAQLAAPLLDPGPGMRVLDACAAPGGKSTHLLEYAPDLRLVSLDRDADRQEATRHNLQRLGLQAEVRTADAAAPDTWWDGEPFDRILLDAPCSATGVIRRHPDIRLLRRAADIEPFAARQAQLLAALWPLLAPGGRLLYATCSLLRAENEAVVANFLGETDNARSMPLAVPGAAAAGPGVQLLPAAGGNDGFYYCLVARD